MKTIYIIAEVGVNHNGSMALAYDLIDIAASGSRRSQISDFYCLRKSQVNMRLKQLIRKIQLKG